jgi:hypothetical protein
MQGVFKQYLDNGFRFNYFSSTFGGLRLRYLYIFFLPLLVLGCNNKEKSHDISSQKVDAFVEVYKDYLVSTVNDTSLTPDRKATFDSSLVHYNLTMDEFTEILFYLRENPKEFDQALGAVIDSLETISKIPPLRP